MKILYFHQYFNTPEGNGGTRSYEAAKYLVQQGHAVTMVYALDARAKSCLTGPYIKGRRTGSYEGINLIEYNLAYSNRLNLLKRTILFLRYAFRSSRLVFSEDFDMIFATTTPLTAAIPGIVAKIFRPKKKFIFEVRDLWPELPKAMGVIKNPFVLWGLGTLEFLAYNLADACVALSPGIKQGIEKRLLKSKKVCMIPNGCDLEIFKPGISPKSVVPGIRDDQFLAIFTGAHGLANGLDAVLDAAKLLIERGFGDQIVFLFVGDGSEKDRLKIRADNEQLFNCKFMNPVSKKTLSTYMDAADIGMMILANVPAFYFGTSPNKFFDYISSGLPVFNNYPGWLAGLIQQHQCGLAVEPNNPVFFADGMIHLYEKREQLQSMRINARQLAESQFARPILTHNLYEFLMEISNEKPKSTLSLLWTNAK